jgi:N-methylhydantoinase A
MLDLVPLRRVIVPPHPGLFSALGLLSSDQVFNEERGVSCRLDASGVEILEAAFVAMEADLVARLPAAASDVRFERSFDGRLQGQGFETPFVEAKSPVTVDNVAEMVSAFHLAYERRNTSRFEHLPIEVVSLRTNAVLPASKVDYPEVPVRPSGGRPQGRAIQLQYLDGESREAIEYHREDLLAGDQIAGPVVVREAMSTTFVPAGRAASVGRWGELVIT